MPRPAKPARLVWEAERYEKGVQTRPGTWVITHLEYRKRTGCGADDRGGAEKALADYLISLHVERRKKPKRALLAEDVACADVLAAYAERKSDTDPKAIVKAVARPKEMLTRIDRLLAFWGDMTLADVDTDTCHAYVRHRGSHAGARRDLEDFQSAINQAIRDGRCREIVRVSLPGKGQAREGWLTRDQVAAIIWYCWRHRRTWRPWRGPNKGKLVQMKRWPYRHLIPYILTCLYTASRSARVWPAAFEELPGRPWIDLDTATYHRMWRGERETKKRAEDIGIPPRLMAHFRRWRRGPLIDGKRRPRTYLVEWEGKPANPRMALIKVLNEVLGPGHGIVLHSLRHTSVTWLVAAGVDTPKIAKFASMTEVMIRTVYRHHHPDSDRDVGEAFSSGRAGRVMRKAPRGIAGKTPEKRRENA